MDTELLTDNWLVQAIENLGAGRWTRALDEPEAVVFTLDGGSTGDWPATVTVVTVADDDWPTGEWLHPTALDEEDDTAGPNETTDGENTGADNAGDADRVDGDRVDGDRIDGDRADLDSDDADWEGEATIRLASLTNPEHALAHVDIVVDGGLTGTPLNADLWIDTAPRLRLTAAASGADLYELARLLDAVGDLLDGTPAASADASSVGTEGA